MYRFRDLGIVVGVKISDNSTMPCSSVEEGPMVTKEVLEFYAGKSQMLLSRIGIIVMGVCDLFDLGCADCFIRYGLFYHFRIP